VIPEIRKSLVVVVFPRKRLDVFAQGMEILVYGIDMAPIRKVANGGTIRISAYLLIICAVPEYVRYSIHTYS
jgi:hypothetical protein